MGKDFTDSIAFPQVALFTILIIIIVYMLSKDIKTTALIGAAIFLLGMNGYLESVGVGARAMSQKCREYVV